MNESLRLSRKKLVSLLEEQQRTDAEAARQIQTIVLDTNRRLMNTLANLLSQLDEVSPLADVQLVTAMLPSFSCKRWSAQRKKRTELKQEQVSKKIEVASASRAYTDHSPFGFMSRWGQDDRAKEESKRLKSIQDRNTAELEAIGRVRDALEARMQETAEQLLRAAMTNKSLEMISTRQSSVQGEVQKLLHQSKDEINEVWGKHMSMQVSSLAKAGTLIREMSDYYTSNNEGVSSGHLLTSGR